ncbi:MAG TPA: KH domain-containing protein [Candidatus Saccharimonadales bacterium]|nr:KH domain-containing protein [Candidatus Saccharimonadales bacterium]
MSSIDQQFVEFIVKSLVSKPDAVVVERRIDEKGVLLELTVDPEDLGRVIGKRGATAQSLRTLLRALGTKNDARYNLKIVDNGEPRPDTPRQQSDDASSDHSQTQPQNDDLADLTSDDDEFEAPKHDRKEESNESMASKTRRELQELDDLDV